MSMDLSIITVNYNTREHIEKCVSAVLTAGSAMEYEMFIVDNDSGDGSQDYLLSLRENARVRVILNQENVGFARANNQAARLCTGRYIMLLNPDTEVMGESLAETVRFMDEESDIGVMGPSIVSPLGTELRVCRKYSLLTYDLLEWMPLLNKVPLISRNYRDGEIDYRRVSDVDYIQGACMVMRCRALEETGLLDERYFMYNEEEDLCRRMKEKGWRVVYNPGVTIMHHWGASTRKERFQKFDTLVESKYLYFKKFYGNFYAGLFRRTMIAVMWLRILYYSLMMVKKSKAESSHYEKELSRCLLAKLRILN
jgi:GT2 family glycosyltransferase